MPAGPTSRGEYSILPTTLIRSSAARHFNQRSSGLRITISTFAPASCNNAPDSNALWPPPTTSTRLPSKTDKSLRSTECETSDSGKPSNLAGRRANGAMPHATTTRRAANSSPSAVVSLKPPFDSSIIRIRRGSKSGATFC